jgi:hypothetical protein
MLDTVLATLDKIEQARERAQMIEAPQGALAFLKAVYQNKAMPLSVRMRAAIEALPFETPKLSATAMGAIDRCFADQQFADRSAADQVLVHGRSPGLLAPANLA